MGAMADLDVAVSKSSTLCSGLCELQALDADRARHLANSPRSNAVQVFDSIDSSAYNTNCYSLLAGAVMYTVPHKPPGFETQTP